MASDWIEKTLGDVVELKRGYDLPKKSREDGCVPVVSSSGTSGSHDQAKVQPPGVVTGRYGTIGQVFLLDEPFWPLNTTLYVRDFKGNDPHFIYYLLQTVDYGLCSDKAAVPGVNRNHLHELPIRVTEDAVEQRAIAEVLGSLDDKIELNRRMNRTLESIARAWFRHRFLDHPDPAWEVKPVGDAVECVGGGTPSTKNHDFWEGGTHAWVTPKDLSGNASPILSDSSRHLTDAGIAKVSSGLLDPGTVLLSSRAPVGYLAITTIPLAINQGFIALKPTPALPASYLLNWCHANMDEIKGRASGSTFAEISKKAFRPIPMLVPPTEVTAEFDETVGPLYDRITANLAEGEILAALRDALLPRLLSGELSPGQAADRAAATA